MLKLEHGRPSNLDGRLGKEIRTYDLLDSLGIEYDRVDHPAANTMAACEEIDQLLVPAAICKNLLLCNSQRTKFFLLMLRGEKKFKTSIVSRQIGSSRLSFAPEEYMLKYLDITPGSLSVLGLMNDTHHAVQLVVDKDLLEDDYFGCHPCINTTSLRLKTADIFQLFLQHTGHDYISITIEQSD